MLTESRDLRLRDLDSEFLHKDWRSGILKRVNEDVEGFKSNRASIGEVKRESLIDYLV